MSFRPLIVLVACAPAAIASQLKPATVEAWDSYIEAAEARLESEEAGQSAWMDQIPRLRERLRGGEIVAWPANSRPSRPVPHGLIHDWVGAVFIQRASVSDVFAVLKDFDHYRDHYGPTVRSAKLLSRNGMRESFRIRYFRKALFVTVELDIDYACRYFQLNDRRWYSVSRSTSIHEIHDNGQPNERTVSADEGSGYVWRAFAISKFDEGDSGVYLEQESIALSRAIPVELRWLVKPFVERLSKELVIGLLRQTREAVVTPRPLTR